jgi:hypothetical protein
VKSGTDTEFRKNLRHIGSRIIAGFCISNLKMQKFPPMRFPIGLPILPWNSVSVPKLKLDGFAVGGVAVGVGPGFHTFEESGGVAQTFRRDEPFEGC